MGLRQCVVVNGCLSSNQKVTIGAPQGSVVMPLLFIIYVNDMPDVVTCMIKMFTDDTKLYSKIASEQN